MFFNGFKLFFGEIPLLGAFSFEIPGRLPIFSLGGGDLFVTNANIGTLQN